MADVMYNVRPGRVLLAVEMPGGEAMVYELIGSVSIHPTEVSLSIGEMPRYKMEIAANMMLVRRVVSSEFFERQDELAPETRELNP